MAVGYTVLVGLVAGVLAVVTAGAIAQPAQARTVPAFAFAAVLGGMVSAELALPDVRRWLSSHQFLTGTASALLILGLTILLVDEVRRSYALARWQRFADAALRDLHGPLVAFYKTLVGPFLRDGEVSIAVTPGQARDRLLEHLAHDKRSPWQFDAIDRACRDVREACMRWLPIVPAHDVLIEPFTEALTASEIGRWLAWDPVFEDGSAAEYVAEFAAVLVGIRHVLTRLPAGWFPRRRVDSPWIETRNAELTFEDEITSDPRAISRLLGRMPWLEALRVPPRIASSNTLVGEDIEPRVVEVFWRAAALLKRQVALGIAVLVVFSLSWGRAAPGGEGTQGWSVLPAGVRWLLVASAAAPLVVALALRGIPYLGPVAHGGNEAMRRLWVAATLAYMAVTLAIAGIVVWFIVEVDGRLPPHGEVVGCIAGGLLVFSAVGAYATCVGLGDAINSRRLIVATNQKALAK